MKLDYYVLGRCNLVLGVEWLKKHSPVLFYFNQLSLAFTKEGKTVSLKGTTEAAELTLLIAMAYKRY